MNRLGTLALAALGLGLAAGTVASAVAVPAVVSETLGWFVHAWTRTLAVIAVPLVIAQLFLAVVEGVGSRASAARVGVLTPIVMVGLLVLAAAVTLPLALLAMRVPGLASLSLRTGHSAGASATPAWSEAQPAVGTFDALLPQEIVRSALAGDLFSLLLVTLAVALAARRIGTAARDLLATVAQGVSWLAFAAVSALLRLAPAVVFAVSFGAVLTSGFDLGPVLVAYAALKALLTLAVIGALYGVVVVAGVPLRRFARATFPGQVVAVTTRSSLASLPALISGARRTLGLDHEVSGGLLGLAGAALKLSGPVSSTFKFLFLAHVLGVSLTAPQIGAFILTILATSATTVGVPRVAGDSSALAFYAAAGIPLEYTVLLSTTTTLTDPISTLLNSTAYMTFTAVVCRLGLGAERPAAPDGVRRTAAPDLSGSAAEAG